MTKAKTELDRLYKQDAGMGYGNLADEWKDAPSWSNEEAQLEYVRNRILAGWFVVLPYRSEEELAVEKALCGKPEQLLALALCYPRLLTPDTLTLVDEFRSGSRNPNTGRLYTGRAEGDVGTPPKTEKERRRDHPTHQAAEIFFVLRDTLPLIYPEQKRRDISKRAMELAAKLKGIETETLQDHRDKSKKRRGLLYRIYGYQEEDTGRRFWGPDLKV
jgi:hypothetical protein